MDTQPLLEPVCLELTFITNESGPTAQVRWDAEVLGTRTSKLNAPLTSNDQAMILRALDALQDPYYPHAWTSNQQVGFHFSPEEQARLQRLGLWDGRGHLRSDAPRQIGRLLFRCLTSDPIAQTALSTVRDHASALGRPLLLMMAFGTADGHWSRYPWELLWADEPQPLLVSRGGSSLERRLDLPLPLPIPRHQKGPLHILALSPRAGIPSELRQIEQAARREAWAPLIASGEVRVTELEPASRTSIACELMKSRPPDMIHFYGHGRYHDGKGMLLLDGPNGGEAWTETSLLMTIFSGVSLVALQACQGAMSGSGEAPLLSGVAQALVAAGVPAVIAMQFSVRTEAAVQFETALYQALAAKASVQAALNAARRDLFTREEGGISWFVPSLFIRSRARGSLFLRREHADAHRQQQSQQRLYADDQSQIERIEAFGGGQSRQAIEAHGSSQISDLRLEAEAHGQQQVISRNGSQIRHAHLREQVAPRLPAQLPVRPSHPPRRRS